MPSDKRNLIMATLYSYQLHFFTVQYLLHPKTCLFANFSCSNTCIMVLPKLTFVLLCAPFLSPLLHRKKFVVRVFWLQCKIWVMLTGAFLVLFFACNVAQIVWKCSSDTPWLRDACTFIVGHTLTIGQCLIFVMARLIVEILLCCFPFMMLCNGLKTNEYEEYWLGMFNLQSVCTSYRSKRRCVPRSWCITMLCFQLLKVSKEKYKQRPCLHCSHHPGLPLKP